MRRFFTLRLAMMFLSGACATTAAAHGHGHGGSGNYGAHGGSGNYGGHGHGDWGHHHDHFHGSIGFYFNDPFFWGLSPLYYSPFYYPPYRPYYYEAPAVVIERDPPVYVQRQAAAVWYYCPNPGGYYPYVQSCAQPWVTVDPHTVAPAR